MLAKYERRYYLGDSKAWIGKYKNLINLPHWHNDCEIITAEKGTAAVFVDGREYDLKERESLYIESARIHYIRAEKNSILSFILFDYRLADEFSQRVCLVSPLLTRDYGIQQTYGDILRELKEHRPFTNLAVSQKISSLLLQIYREEETIPPPKMVSDQDKRYKELLEEIDKNYSFYTFSDAADFMGFSKPYFSKYFHKISGMPFACYLNSVRVEKAVEILKKDKDQKYTEIASRCGFNTIRNFNRVFKRITGFSPNSLPDDYDNILTPVESFTDFDPTEKSSELLSD